MSLVQPGKYIKKLVKIISEKEKMIDQLRKNVRSSQISDQQEERSINSMSELRLKEELAEVNQQVKSMVTKINQMETHILQLTEGLKEEMGLNEILQKKIEEMKSRQKTLLLRLESSETQKQRYERQMAIQEQKQKQSVLLIQLQNKNLNEKLSINQSEINQLKQNLQKERKISHCIGQSIESIFQLTSNYHLEVENYDKKGQKLDLNDKLKKIEAFIKQMTNSESDVFDETLEGISIIMHSFQQKLEEVHCLTDRQNNSEEIDQKLKESAKSMPVAKQRKSYIKIQSPYKQKDIILEPISQ